MSACGPTLDPYLESHFRSADEERGSEEKKEEATQEERQENAVSQTTSSETEEKEESVQRNRPQKIVINELLYDLVGADTDGQVFVELYGDARADVTGYQLVFINGENGVVTDSIVFSEEAKVAEDGIFLIADAKTGNENESFVDDADLIKNFDPQNGPDCVQLLDENGVLLDALGYGSPIVEAAENGNACHEGESALDVPSGQSLSRINGTDTENNAMDFMALTSPSPGVL